MSSDLYTPPVSTVTLRNRWSLWGVGTAGNLATMLLLAGAVMTACVITGSSRPLLAAGLMVAAQALSTAIPAFGSRLYWQWHYFWSASAGTEDWFASAEEAARVVRPYLNPTDRVLVVGCGTSGIVNFIAPAVAEVTAVDISATALRVSQGRCSCSNVPWLKADVRDMRALFSDESFDLVLYKGTYAALECVSVEEAAQGFSEARRVLKPRGLLITFLLGYPAPTLLEQLAVLQVKLRVVARYDTGESEAAGAMAFAVRKLAKDDNSEPPRYGNGALSWYRHQDRYDDDAAR